MLIVVLKTILLFPYLLYKYFKDKSQRGIHLYGTYGYYGLAGAGKTYAMSRRLRELRQKYGDRIYIMTNYFYDDQDFEFTSWRDLLKEYDKPLVCAWDELPNEFNSRDFKDFPVALFSELTQLRKGNGIQILYSCQRWYMADKNFRMTSFGCYDCKTILGNLTYTRLYDPIDYDNLCSNSDYEKRRKIRPKMTESFLQTEDIRNCYDSYKRLESSKNKEYMDRTEIGEIYKLAE